MKAELVKKWLGKLTRLNPASGHRQCRGKAPHKPLLLLCLVDLAEAGELPGRTFTRTANLVLRFKEYGALVSGEVASGDHGAATAFDQGNKLLIAKSSGRVQGTPSGTGIVYVTTGGFKVSKKDS